MTGTSLEKVSSNRVVEKNKTEKPKMSYLEALDAMQKYDAEIKEAAKIRTENEFSADYDISNHSAKKMLLATVTSTTASAVGLSTGMLSGDTGALLLFGSVLGGVISTLATWIMPAPAKFLSPRKYKQLVEKEKFEQSLVDLKEQEFSQVEAVILKKAKKARKIIDRNLIAQNKFSNYQRGPGCEGFVISDIQNMTDWEKEKIRAQYSLEERMLETPSQKDAKALSEVPARKELTA